MKKPPSYETQDLREFAEILRGRRTINLYLNLPVPTDLVNEAKIAADRAVIEQVTTTDKVNTFSGVELSLDGHGSVSIPFEFTGGKPVQTKVWQDPVEAVDEGDAVADWLTYALGAGDSLRMVRMAPGFRRRLQQAERFGEDTTTQFADSAPFLVANEASLEALNRELESNGHPPVPMNRFRPNIVVRGPTPYSEHQAGALAGDGWRLAMVDHCERCVVTMIDQETAERDPAREPFQTRRRINPAPGPGGAPAFAQNATLDSGEGAIIATGAEIFLH